MSPFGKGSMSKDWPELTNPPVVEVVLGVQFAPLTRMASAHMGRFWTRFLGPEWDVAADAPAVPDAPDPQFGGVNPTGGMDFFRFQTTPMTPRVQISRNDGARLLQLQSSRFHYNWQKKDEAYPTYQAVRREFDEQWSNFNRFVESEGLGPITPTLWEVTYIDYVAPGGLWTSPEDWPHVIPGLLGRPALDGGRATVQNAACQWTFEIAPRLGHVSVQAGLGAVRSTEQPGLILQTTARGRVTKGTANPIGTGLDVGRDACLEIFFAIVSEAALQAWGRSS